MKFVLSILLIIVSLTLWQTTYELNRVIKDYVVVADSYHRCVERSAE